jgi:hypothetical protein
MDARQMQTNGVPPKEHKANLEPVNRKISRINERLNGGLV